MKWMFDPELALGGGELSSARRREVGDYVVDVIRQRGFPMHLANLWNALYFRWDLKQRRYVAATIEPSRIPRRRMNARDDPLPVGAFIRVETKAQVGDIWAEVIYKEGAHPDVSADYLDPGLCGAPGAAVELDGRSVIVVRERFVLDIGAFGPEQNNLSVVAYERLLKRGRWIDERGHLVMDAVYSPEEAQLEDVDLYINYLLGHHREGLLAFCFSDEPTEEELREALVRSFAAVRDLAAGRPELCSWREKMFFDRQQYRDQVRDQGRFPLCAGDLGHLFNGLCRLPKGNSVGYLAVSPRLDDLLASGGIDPEERDLMVGPGYAKAIAYANCFIRDRLQETSNGQLNGVHLRVDDDWQGGAVWRCEKLDGPSSLTFLPPDLPLHLGLAEAAVGAVAMQDLQGSAEPVATTRGITVALGGRDLASGRLRLPAVAVEQLDPSTPVMVRLRHDGERSTHQVTLDRVHGEVRDIPWPLSFYPGIRLAVNIERRGSVLNLGTKPLIQPIVIDGSELRYDFDRSIYERERVGPGLPAGDRGSAATLNELIHRAFRRYGRDVDDQGKALTYGELVRAVLGPGVRASESQALANALEPMQLERTGAEYVWRPRLTRATAVSDRSVLDAYGEAKPQRRLRRIVRRHYVPMHLRRMRQRGVGADRPRTYAGARIKYGMQGLLPEQLPEGYTWVTPHERGATNDFPVVSALGTDE